MLWNEKTIREEFKRLDSITGLKGAELPIRFGKATSYLGLYYYAEGKGFYFSTYYFDDPDFQVESALDVIRHEYAHYMNHVLYNGYGHDKMWKKCCKTVGAIPIRCYNEERNGYRKAKRQKELNQEKKLGMYKVGQYITHPHFGKGVIENIEKSGNSFIADIGFDTGFKRLSLEWIDKNCKQKGGA